MKEIKKGIKELPKKIVALFVSLSMVLNYFLPVTIVHAEEAYTITFQAEGEHNIANDNGTLKIDGDEVTLKDGNESNIGEVGCSTQDNKTTCSITVSNGVGGSLYYDSTKFTLYNTQGHTAYNGGSLITNTVFLVEDYANLDNNDDPNNNGDNNNNNNSSLINVQLDTENINGNVATFNLDDTNVTLTVNGATIENGSFDVDRNNMDKVTFTIGNTFNSETMVVVIIGADNYYQVLNVSNNTASLSGLGIPDGGIHLGVEYKRSDDQGDDQQPQIDDENFKDIEFDVKFTDTHINTYINNKVVFDDREGQKDSFKGTIEKAGNVEENETNILKFQPVFGDAPASSYIINGITYTKDSDAVRLYDEKTGEIEIEVPGASKYTITGVADSTFVAPRTIIWTNPNYVPKDEEDAAWTSDFKFTHGYAKAIEVYDKDNHKLDPSEYTNTIQQPDGSRSDQYGLNNGFGLVSVYPGSKVVFEFIPDYGYQLTSISINEQPMAATNTINRFEITIPENPEGSGNVHFGATFTKTEDIVKTNSTSINSGEIALGNELEGGSAQLTISDTSVSSNKKAQFENVAGAYEITNYLDIDLYNVYYKGKNDANDVWSKQIEDLNEYATISMKLKENIDADDIAIVHNIHNGDEFETIKIDSYDEATNTITFKTKSFSNYAIAVKPHEIKNVNIELDAPKIGSKVTAQEISDGNMGYFEQDNVPVAREEANASYTIDETMWVKGTYATAGDDYLEAISTTFEEDTYYYAMISISTKDGYIFDSGLNIKVNGQVPAEVFGLQDNGKTTFFIAKIKPIKEAIIESKDNIKEDNSAKEEVAKIVDEILNGREVSGVSSTVKSAIIDAVENDKTITVDVKEESIKEEDIKEDASIIKTLIGEDSSVAAYFDITVVLSVDGNKIGNVTLLDNKIAITLDIPSDIKEVAEGYTRKYTVVRVHDGVAEELDTTLNNDKTVTFKTDKFSTYALTYTDTKATPKEENIKVNPKTVDNVLSYVVLLTISIVGVIGVSILKKKKSNN